MANLFQAYTAQLQSSFTITLTAETKSSEAFHGLAGLLRLPAMPTPDQPRVSCNPGVLFIGLHAATQRPARIPFSSPDPLTGSDLFDLMLRNLVTHPQSPAVGFSHQPSILAATFSLPEVWSLAASGADHASLV